MKLLENYLKFLYTDLRGKAACWRGPNIPFEENVDDRPNYVRKCLSLESDRMKINCLRKLKDQIAMNPQYRDRMDRFVDAITQTYEPTEEPGTIPGNEFKTSRVGEELTENDQCEAMKATLQTLRSYVMKNRHEAMKPECKKDPNCRKTYITKFNELSKKIESLKSRVDRVC